MSPRYISADYRPAIWVRVLPALENILYGANLSNILSAHKHAVLDILAWLPYRVVHYVSPVIVSACMFIWAPPGTLPIWARAFGYMNITAVLIQIVFPCSPPWYENSYGLALTSTLQASTPRPWSLVLSPRCTPDGPPSRRCL
jgi:hypothetical protein